jgi:hypothetical protein
LEQEIQSYKNKLLVSFTGPENSDTHDMWPQCLTIKFREKLSSALEEVRKNGRKN